MATLQTPLPASTSDVAPNNKDITDETSVLPKVEPNNPSTTMTMTPQSEENDEPVDSALLAALRDPRERLGLLKLEQAMMDFMKQSSDNFIEIGGYYNAMIVSPSTGIISSGGNQMNDYNRQRPATTFQRCILHRLADRFLITRESGSLVEGYIRIVKGSDSSIPKQLLVDLDPSVYAQDASGMMVNDATRAVEQMTIAGSSGPVLNNTANINGNTKPRKMKIMKRDSSGGSSKNSSSSKSSAPRRGGKNFSDKEKAYAEARARIFGNESEEAGSTSGTDPVATTATTPVSSNTPSPSITPSTSFHGLPSGSGASSNGEEDGNAPPNQNSNVKATYRNRQVEESDPDFRRGRGLVPTAAAFTPSTTASPAVGYGYGIPNQHSGGNHLYHQQQQQGYAPGVSVQNYYHSTQVAQSPMYAMPPQAGYAATASPYGQYPSYPPQAVQYQQHSSSPQKQKPAANVNCLKEFPTLG